MRKATPMLGIDARRTCPKTDCTDGPSPPWGREDTTCGFYAKVVGSGRLDELIATGPSGSIMVDARRSRSVGPVDRHRTLPGRETRKKRQPEVPKVSFCLNLRPS
ncbi:hypothetical protein BH09MYX1_BH09MYX1_21660 [soil metagenome]